jgi:hypothetical protein
MCNCFNASACEARRRKGLVPFCEMTLHVVPVCVVDDGTFPTLASAQAAYPGQRVGLVSGGLGTGSAARFGLTWSEYKS